MWLLSKQQLHARAESPLAAPACTIPLCAVSATHDRARPAGARGPKRLGQSV